MSESKYGKCPDCGSNTRGYHSSHSDGYDNVIRVVCVKKCQEWKVIKEIYPFKKTEAEMSFIKTLDLGWAMCRLTTQSSYPKHKLEILTPADGTDDAFMPAHSVTVSDNFLIQLRDLLNEAHMGDET